MSGAPSFITAGGGGGLPEIPLPDGAQALPRGLNWSNELTMGFYRIGLHRQGFAVGNFTALEMGNATQLNVDPVSPSTVRYVYRGYLPALAGVNEVAHAYVRIDPVAGNRQQAALYVDITSNQLDTDGPAIKVVHAGGGDGIYVAQFSNGSAYEAATWGDGSRGFISTIQVAGLPNSTLFNALCDVATVPNYGMYLADRSPGNAYTVITRTGANPGQTQIRVIDQAAGRMHFAAYTDGSIALQPDEATGGGDQASPELRIYASSWDGAAAQPNGFIVKTIPNGAPNAALLAFYAQSPLGTQLVAQLTNDNTAADQTRFYIGANGAGQVRAKEFFSGGVADLIVNGGNLALRCDDDPNVDDSYLEITVNQSSGGDTLKHVVQAAPDSAGPGLRALAVPNDAGDDTAVDATDFAATNWGTIPPTIVVTAGSNRQRGEVAVTCNDVDAGAAWSLTLTFPTAFAAAPFGLAIRTDDELSPPEVTSMSARIKSGDLTAATLKITPYPGGGGPVNTKTYVFTWMVQP